jgi:hypothetical protein
MQSAVPVRQFPLRSARGPFGLLRSADKRGSEDRPQFARAHQKRTREWDEADLFTDLVGLWVAFTVVDGQER